MSVLQSSDDWQKARVGHVTASRVGDVIAKTKTGWGASRTNYAAQLVAERLTGKASDNYINAAMQWGLDTEPHAKAAYEFVRDANVLPAAFILHPSIEWTGATPDGFVGDDGLVEFKCPNTATHIETLRDGGVPGRYVAQVQWQLACSGRKWCDFVSFDPRMPERMRLYVHRLERDDDMIGALESHVEAFLAEVDDTLRQLHRRYTKTEQA